MRILKAIFLLLLSLFLIVLIALFIRFYITESFRYKLSFGIITANHGQLSSARPGITSMEQNPTNVCFKFDSLTGKTWIYTDELYYDPNITITIKGWIPVESGEAARSSHKRNTLVRRSILEELELDKLPKTTNRLSGLIVEPPKKTGGMLSDLVAPEESNQVAPQKRSLSLDEMAATPKKGQ